MSSKDFYKELLEIYASEYRNPKVVLEHHIDELINQGKTREEAIATIYEREKRPEDTQESLARRVKQLESELDELKTSGSEAGSDAVSESREGLSIAETVLMCLTSPVSAIIAWLIWHEDEPYKADQAVGIGVLMFVLEIIAFWFLFL
jgi:hypothetical protein